MLSKRGNKKNQSGFDGYEDNLQSMRSWVRKIEQSTNSIGSRLKAVEKRISDSQDFDESMFPSSNSSVSSLLTELDSHETTDDGFLEAVSKLLEGKLMFMEQQLTTHKHDISQLKKQIDEINKSLVKIKNDVHDFSNYQQQLYNSLQNRLNKLEQSAPMLMRLGSWEIPVEIAGVIAGGISLLAALLVSIGEQGVLITPLFLAFVGVVFIGSALFKTLRLNRYHKKNSP